MIIYIIEILLVAMLMHEFGHFWVMRFIYKDKNAIIRFRMKGKFAIPKLESVAYVHAPNKLIRAAMIVSGIIMGLVPILLFGFNLSWMLYIMLVMIYFVCCSGDFKQLFILLGERE